MTTTINFRHRDAVETILMNDLQVGDLVWNCGCLFEVTEIFCYKDGNRVVIRYTGLAVEGYNSYKNTGFDGGRYGGLSDLTTTIVRRNLIAQS